MAVERPAVLDDSFIDGILERISQNKPVRRSLPVWGRIHVDRKLPFLFLYRKPVQCADEGTESLLLGEAAYILASGDRKLATGLSVFVRRLVEASLSEFGACLLVEVWSSPGEVPGLSGSDLGQPGFRLYHEGSKPLFSTVEAFDRSLREIRIRQMRPEVESLVDLRARPPGMGPCLPASVLAAPEAYRLGVAVRPFYRSASGGSVYPIALRELRREFSKSTKHALVAFVRHRTPSRPAHYQLLGRRTVVKAAWQADRILAEVSDEIDFLLSVTPINLRSAWTAFARNRAKTAPRFGYRSLLIAPLELKHKLFSAPIKRIEDPELSWMFRKKQRELDLQLSALAARDSPDFLYASLLVFGAVDESLLRVANNVLERASRNSSEDRRTQNVTADEFAERARKELALFKLRHDQTEASVEITPDVTGLVVSRGTLFVGSDLHVPSGRLEALVQHEVGTHLLTYLNGMAQPFQLLHAGLAGYDELQEGLAVLSEYLVGGLGATRLRLLAARVIAVKSMTDGADFVETYNLLTETHGFAGRAAFGITARVFRAGGLTKDAVYLRGLIRILKYLRDGGRIEPLFVGKVGADDLSVIEELLRRKVLRPPPLVPSYMDNPQAVARLRLASRSASPLDLLTDLSPPRRQQGTHESRIDGQ